MANLKETTTVLTYLAALYPQFQLRQGTCEAYQTILSDIEPAILKAAAVSVASASHFFPAASELRQAALELVARAQGIPNAAEAWGEVMREIRGPGYYGHPTFSTPLIYRAVDALGGWKELCTSENAVADRAHFLKIYDSLLTRHKEERAMLPEVREAIAMIKQGSTVPQLKGGDDA